MVFGLLVFGQLALCLAEPENLLDSSILLQARKKAKDKKARDASEVNAQVKGDQSCTGNDMWLWLGDHKEKATADNEHLWVKQTPAEFSAGTEVHYAKTAQHRERTCKKWCEHRGKRCVRGMDDAHHQSKYAFESLTNSTHRCTLWPAGHDRQRDDEAGCLQRWATQMCACGEVQTLPMNLNCYADPDTDATILFRACGVASANPNDPYDSTQMADFLLRGEDGATVKVNVSDAGHFLIGSDGASIISPEFTVEGGPKTGRELILPPDFSFFMLPYLQDGQSFTIVNAEDARTPLDSLIITQTPEEPLEFTKPPQFRVVSGDALVEIEMKATPNLVSNCLNKYTKVKDNSKCKYQNKKRLWRRTDQTLKDCYELCASTPDCQYFSFDAVSTRWAGVCMGCTSSATPGRHTDFTFYEVCKRSDVRGQCEQHEEHQCRHENVLKTLTGLTGVECRDECKKTDNCSLFAFDGADCQLCKNHHKFQGKGQDSMWTVLGSDCTEAEINAKFSD